tara:strand:+ start:4429 stop:5100 length:672 start_codon:yes stop_codon:yes gene_type:complete
MAVKRISFAVLVLISLIGTTMISSVQGHTAQAHMALIKENGLTQGNPTIIQNDSVIWANVDNSSNLTHRIVYDHDGDGLYNGTFDWDSGELHAYCERDENNSKIDPSCSTEFTVILDLNWSIGNYTYQNIRSDNVSFNGTIQLTADTANHLEQNLPAIGSQFGVNNDESEVDDSIEEESGLTPEKMLLLVGLFTGVLSVILLGILMLRRSDPKTFDNIQYESE